MTSGGGGAAMAAAPGAGPGAEGEERRLLRGVTRLQAAARGFLLRRRLRSVRAEFEALVLRIEGHRRQLRWSGRHTPSFEPGPSPEKPSDPGQAAHTGTPRRARRERADPPGAERAGSCGSSPSSAPNPPQNPGADKTPAAEGRASGPEIPAELRGLSRRELQSHRNHLLMELLWVQQAIASRKNFLMLKQKLGIPNHPAGVPEFLDAFGESLELQQRS